MGQHNREIAKSLGVDADEIDAMVRDGVLYSPA
jgi:crotonobetainyl-CoA:carnitine CoA-transferase CaiB-like acyl-CoA transferase